MPDFPFVPALPGVPPLFRDASNSDIPTPDVLTGDGSDVSAMTASMPQWGLFNSDGSPAITPDSVVSMRFLDPSRVSDFPIEQGSFSSYNKVTVPFEGHFVFNKGGMLADRTTFLQALQTIRDDTNLYTFATPEISYANVNLEDYQYERKAENGFQLIAADLHLVEIRVAASPNFSNTADPTAQGATNNGAVQPQTPTAAQTSGAQAGLAGAQGVGTLTIGPPGDG